MFSVHDWLPIKIAGDLTEKQDRDIRSLVDRIVQNSIAGVLRDIDTRAAEALLENHKDTEAHLTRLIHKTLLSHGISNRYESESVPSRRVYPPTYVPRPIEAQTTDLRKAFPGKLQVFNEKLARRPVPPGAEGWFAYPRWRAIAPTYQQAVEEALRALGAIRRIDHRLVDRLNSGYLTQTSRTMLAEDLLAKQQGDADILIVPAQFGLRHCGASARRVRSILDGNEYGLGLFALISMLLTYPYRLHVDSLMLDCSGDDYALNGGGYFSHVPLLDYGMGIEVSCFYNDRACERWSTPTGFLWTVPAPESETGENGADPAAVNYTAQEKPVLSV